MGVSPSAYWVSVVSDGLYFSMLVLCLATPLVVELGS